VTGVRILLAELLPPEVQVEATKTGKRFRVVAFLPLSYGTSLILHEDEIPAGPEQVASARAREFASRVGEKLVWLRVEYPCLYKIRSRQREGR